MPAATRQSNCTLSHTLSHYSQHFSPNSRARSFGADEYIIRKGETGEHFYILEEGTAVALIPQPDGTEQPVKSYEPGELFGEKALLESGPRNASIRAEGPVKCFKLSRRDFEENLGPLSQLRAQACL